MIIEFLKTNTLRAVIGNPKKDFRFRLLPGLIQDARERVDNAHEVPAMREATPTSRAEFAKRYKNLRLAVFLIWGFALISFVQTIRSEIFIFSLGALLSGLLMVVMSLQHLHRLHLARFVWRHWGRADGVHSTFRDYLATCVKQPRELLPLALPFTGNAR